MRGMGPRNVLVKGGHLVGVATAKEFVTTATVSMNSYRFSLAASLPTNATPRALIDVLPRVIVEGHDRVP